MYRQWDGFQVDTAQRVKRLDMRLYFIGSRALGGSDGSHEPRAGLIADKEGALYGTTLAVGELAMAQFSS